MRDPAQPDLSIIIVSWNVREFLAACLNSLSAAASSCPHECLVIDCASEDGSAAMVAEQFPRVRLFRAEENIGFVRANNWGMREALGRHFLLLNPDTFVAEGALPVMRAEMEHEPRIGILGPQHFNSDGSHQSTRRRFPNGAIALLESTWLQALAPPRLLAHYYLEDLSDEGSYDVDWVQGSALWVRRELWQAIGGMDERYTMYFEEVDWCQRARRAGWRVRYHGAACITHHGGASSEQVPTMRQWHFDRSKLRYTRQYQGRALALLLLLVLRSGYLTRMALEAGKWLLGHKRALRLRRLRGYGKLLVSPLWP
ncbi:MAG: glycosyltransferase family 2 protein [Chloroflexi bacterium]|nr:glycosyltransferase family 2 protein [Chloroflexota bacterium]